MHLSDAKKIHLQNTITHQFIGRGFALPIQQKPQWSIPSLNISRLHGVLRAYRLREITANSYA
jgi:hypothetical protein